MENYTEFLKIIKELIMKLPTWRFIWLSLIALLIFLIMFADKVAVLIQAVK